MDNNKLSIHAQAVNLARRWTTMNEPDLMQENLFEDSLDSMTPSTPKKYDRDTCKELASHMMHYKSLPMECKKFGDIAADLKRRDSDTTDPTSLLS